MRSFTPTPITTQRTQRTHAHTHARAHDHRPNVNRRTNEWMDGHYRWELAVKTRQQMREMGVPPDDITFLHLFTACAKRTKQVNMVG